MKPKSLLHPYKSRLHLESIVIGLRIIEILLSKPYINLK
jgi:hypothetical protein